MSNEAKVARMRQKIKDLKNNTEGRNMSLDEVADKNGVITLHGDDINNCGSFVFYSRIIVQVDKPKKPI